MILRSFLSNGFAALCVEQLFELLGAQADTIAAAALSDSR
jgi:hypothetical protein